MKTDLEYLKMELQKMQAVETLEYLDKNHLSGDNKSRSEVRQEQLSYCLSLVTQIEEKTTSKK